MLRYFFQIDMLPIELADVQLLTYIMPINMIP